MWWFKFVDLFIDLFVVNKMDINIPKYLHKPIMNKTSRGSDHLQPSITGILSALPTAYIMHSSTNSHSSKTMHVSLNSRRENLTY